jgi:uncharacterized protein YybS (DUF2232 family)
MVLFTLMTGSVGLVMGYYYQQKSSSFFPVLAGLLTYLANYTLYIFIAYFMTGANAFDYFQQAIESQLTASNSTRFAPVVEGDLDQLIDESISMLTQLLPGWLIISSIVLALLNHYAARKILTRFGLELDPLPPFRRWNLPKAVLYYYLVALFLLLFKIVEQGSRLYMPVLNFNFVLEILLLIQGLSLVAHVFYLKGINRLLLVIVGGLSFIPLIGSLIRVAGILDLGFNLKERLNHALRS